MIPVSKKAEIKHYIDPKFLLKECGGEVDFDFDKILRDDPFADVILFPPLWTLPEGVDYYPPPGQTPLKRLAANASRITPVFSELQRGRSRRRESNILEQLNLFEDII